jgi:hypothetical protein
VAAPPSFFLFDLAGETTIVLASQFPNWDEIVEKTRPLGRAPPKFKYPPQLLSTTATPKTFTDLPISGRVGAWRADLGLSPIARAPPMLAFAIFDLLEVSFNPLA